MPGLKRVFTAINSSDCKCKVTYQTTEWWENPTGGGNRRTLIQPFPFGESLAKTKAGR